MGAFLVRRFALAVVTVALGSAVIFFLLRVLPGDVALFMLASSGGVRGPTEEELAAVKHQLGLDRSLPIQYADWIKSVLKGEMGQSFFRKTPISKTIVEKGWLTVQITILGMIFAWIVGLPLGVISAMRRNSLTDYVARLLSILGLSVPNFWLALLVVVALARWFRWSTPLDYSPPWEAPLTNFQQVLAPSLVLAIPLMAFVARMVRSSMLEVLGEDFIRTARSKGLRERSVITRHTLKIALLPALTLSGVQIGLILGATVIIESVFGVDGLSKMLLEGVLLRDVMLVQSVLLVFVVAFIIINLVTDILYSWLDPRIRFG